ncbi:volume-regulated anion channel subunit LRRC8A-like [Solea solea]|uniref:volume-regulated anion channel subunit LRRC8A-like n=1 Tax=Solea solea TaxID=90069 RepID=UPI00272BFE37|nr:volume-regulated anion channel subunit LRRC8A-like [Solea solea]
MLPAIDTKPEKHILKPWWDIFTDYISVFMMLIAVFSIYLQITRETVTCLPCNWVDNKQCKTVPFTNVTADLPTARGISRSRYISNYCYENNVHWFAKYFPYLMCVHTIIFMACSKFLFTILSTSSKLENFVSILLKCDDSPWTTKALSETVVGETDPTSKIIKSRIDTVLSKKDGEQAKALFEKVKKFRIKVEKGDIVYRVYICQTIIKIINVLLIITYPFYYINFIDFNIVCEVFIGGYSTFSCIYTSAKPYRMYVWVFITLGVFCTMICFYTLCWMWTRSLKTYSFESMREESRYSDIPDMVKDFALMLHLTEQYNPLYTERFAVFLSEVSEKKLKQVNLDNEWTLEKLSQHITKDIQEKLELHLFSLSGIPNAIFELKELEVLKLEHMQNLHIPPNISQLSNLTEMWLFHTSAKIDPPALAFLSENLKTLHVSFTDITECPRWICSLRTLIELHLTCTIGATFISATEMLKDLKMLKALYLRNSLTKLPYTVLDVSTHLQKLSINNSGTKLDLSFGKPIFTNLRELELVSCNLKHVPSIIFSLHNLQEIDLKDNNLTSIEAILTNKYPKWLVCLKVWYNNITHIPLQMRKLARLQRLYLNNNNIENVPKELFDCQNLRFLDLSHNKLTSISANVGQLQKLQYFAVTANWIETLPPELFKCKKLHTLNVGNNRLQTLPSCINELTMLTELELRENLLSSLPVELGECRLLKKSRLVVEDNLFDTLQTTVKEQFLAE